MELNVLALVSLGWAGLGWAGLSAENQGERSLHQPNIDEIQCIPSTSPGVPKAVMTPRDRQGKSPSLS